MAPTRSVTLHARNNFNARTQTQARTQHAAARTHAQHLLQLFSRKRIKDAKNGALLAGSSNARAVERECQTRQRRIVCLHGKGFAMLQKLDAHVPPMAARACCKLIHNERMDYAKCGPFLLDVCVIRRSPKTVRFGDGHTAHKPLLFDTVSSSMTHVRSANL